MGRLRIATCQINTVVGDLTGNVDRIVAALGKAETAGADLAVFPELAVTGYPPEDLVLKSGFVSDNLAGLAQVAASTGRCGAVVGFVDRSTCGQLFNAAALCSDGTIKAKYHKRWLPNYSVFDEQRYFVASTEDLELFRMGGWRIGVSICEDAWSSAGPIPELGRMGADLIVNLNASPYYAGRLEERRGVLAQRAKEAGCPIVYVNQVGGQDELVFDGASMVVGADGTLQARAGQFVDEVMILDLDLDASPIHDADRGPIPTSSKFAPSIAEALGPAEEVYAALVMGTADYVGKNGFTDVVIGLSGGVDSSLVAAVACDALGANRVHGVAMPSRYSSAGSLDDAALLATNLGLELMSVPIEAAHQALMDMLGDSSGAMRRGLTEENLQSRVRGVILMALSNDHGWMVLTTGNKSELATGYSTLYGDSVGGFAVIKDLPKTMVYALCRDRNARAGFDLIPASVLVKPPSAELRPDQRDDQSLPPYDVLDPLLAAYVEEDMTVSEMVDAGFDVGLAARVAMLVDVAEYKRRQNPPGVRVSAKAFGKDRRMPITNGYGVSNPFAPPNQRPERTF